MTKMAAKWLKSIPNLLPKRLKNPTLWGRTYQYSPYKGVPPPGHHILSQILAFLKMPEQVRVRLYREERACSRGEKMWDV